MVLCAFESCVLRAGARSFGSMPNLTTNLSADAPADHGGAVSNSSTPNSTSAILSADLPSNHGGAMSNSSTSRPVSYSSTHMGAQSASLLASRHNHDVDDHLSNHNDTNENILGGAMSNSSTSRPVSHSSAHMGAQSASLLASRHNHDVDDHLSNHNDTNENILVHNSDDHNSDNHNIYYYDWNNDNLAFDYDNIRDDNCSLPSY
mmetsp:Transcript_87076/g.281106  ORF Transcript_87076/g.281106 Transcript_87076/m.281106 type:complete len:205 (+) Transcript_87076:328-942(+)